MGRPRLKLQTLLESLIDGKVYYQAPSSPIMKYPCIVYDRSDIDIEHANNSVYKTDNRYTVTVIYTDPESDLPFKLAHIPTAKHDDHFINDNLYHDVFTIYF